MKSIQETVAAVQNAPGSMYTREDVISLLSNLEINSAPTLSSDMIKNLIESVKEAISNKLSRLDCSDVIDYDSAEFELSHQNRVELQSVDIDTDKISDELENTIEDAITDFFQEGGLVDEIINDIIQIEKAS